MIARIRKSIEEKDKGFTLIELLVVIIIIGILAAIAIPVFLNQRKKAVDAGIKSDLRTVATEMETYFTDNQVYPPTGAVTGGTGATPNTMTIGADTITLTAGNTIAVKLITSGYCLFGTNPNGTSATLGYSYDSTKGGLQAGAAAAIQC